MLKIIRSKITFKLLAVSISLSIIPTILFGIFIYGFFYDDYFNRMIETSTNMLRASRSGIDEKMQRLSMASTLAVTDKSLRSLMQSDLDFSESKGGVYFKDRYVLAREFFYSLEVINFDICGGTLITNRDIYYNLRGQQIYDPGFADTYKNMDWYMRSYKERGYLLVLPRHKPYQTTGGRVEVISVARSIFDAISQDYLGTIILDADVTTLSKVISSSGWDKGDSMILIDEAGGIICSDDIAAEPLDILLRLNYGGAAAGHFKFTVGNASYLLNYVTSDVTGWRVCHLIPEAIVADESRGATFAIVYSMSIIVTLMIIGLLYTISSVSRPIVRLSGTIARIGRGDLSDYSNEFERRVDEIGLLSRSIYDMKDSLRDSIQKLAGAISGQRTAQLKALQSQINPHFILNTLNSIQMMARIDRADDVAQALEKLGVLFKNNIYAGKMLVPLREETRFAVMYMELLKIRHGQKFDFEYDIEHGLGEYYCLRFIVQPVIENAIQHGVEPKRGHSTIRFGGRQVDDSHIVLYVEDNGIGIPEETLIELHSRLAAEQPAIQQTEHGMGLLNVHERLRLHYGDSYGISIDSELGVGTLVEITIPVLRSDGISDI